MAYSPQFMTSGSSALKPLNLNQFKGRAGEITTELGYVARMKENGFKSITARTGAQGLDHLMISRDSDGLIRKVIAVDSKFGTSQLKSLKDGTWQMSPAWVSRNMKRDIVDVLDNYARLDEAGDVIVDSNRKYKPWSTKIDLGSVREVGNDSFYYTKDGKTHFYVGKGDEALLSPEARQKAVRRDINSYEGFADHPESVRLRVVRYEIEDTGKITEIVASVEVSESGKPVENVIETRTLNKKGVNTFVGNEEFIKCMQGEYDIPDASALKNLAVKDKTKLLKGQVSVDVSDAIMQSKANRQYINQKLGLNPGTNLERVMKSESVTDGDRAKILRGEVDNGSDLGKQLARASTRASILATSTRTAIWAGAGAALGFASELIRTRGEIKDVDWRTVGISSGTFAAGYLVSRMSEKLVFKFSSNEVVKNLGSAVINAGTFAIAMAIDTAFDAVLLYGEYRRGALDISHFALSLGINSVGNLAANALPALGVTIGGLAGPVGSTVGYYAGVAIGALFTLGSQFILDPVTNSVEIKNLLAQISGEDGESVVSGWSSDYWPYARLGMVEI